MVLRKKLNYKPKSIKCWLFTPARIFVTLIKDGSIMSWSRECSTRSWIQEWALGLCHRALQGTVPCLHHRMALPSPGRDKSRGNGSYWPFRQRGTKMEMFFKVHSIFQANTKWRPEINSVYFILNKMGIIFEGPHKILAFMLAVWSYEMLTSVLLQRYFKSRVSRFRLNQYITEGV